MFFKSHTCGELRSSHIGQEVTLAGWVHRTRDHGGIIFIDLRDRFGITQVVANPEISAKIGEVAGSVRSEWVIQIKGVVNARPADAANLDLPTGEIEIIASELVVLNKAKPLPFTVSKNEDTDENIRLRYRYLDLRTPRMKRNLEMRHDVIRFFRNYLADKGFIEVETPILFKTTPEGARDYLVPSRLYPGQFYALPQSPQQLKQLLMVAGVERYFQIARCFRDEDQRGDRQPEFTQLDIEMSFIDREDILQLVEPMFTKMVEQVVPEKRVASSPWPRITYVEAMERFGRDAPDLRFGMELKNVTDIVTGCGYKVFDDVTAAGGHVRGINASGLAGYSRKQIDELTDYVKQHGAKGLAYAALPLEGGDPRSPFVKFLSAETWKSMMERMEAKPGDLLLFVADQPAVVLDTLGRLRILLGDRLNLRDPNVLAFCWVLDFPLFAWDPEGKRWDPIHHMFTSPLPEDMALLDSDPGKVRGAQYDIVLNNYEIGSGSIRIHDRELQDKLFDLVGFSKEVAQERFGHMLEAFEFGAPPHGGIAPGIDRICMILAGEPNIREVIAFPKNQAARDVMSDAPSEAMDDQLKDLHIKVDLPPSNKPQVD